MKQVTIYTLICFVAALLAATKQGFFDVNELTTEASELVKTNVSEDFENPPTGRASLGRARKKPSEALPAPEQSLQAFMAFGSESAGLIHELEVLDESQRNVRLDKYLKDLERFEQEGRLIASEAMMLKIQVLKLRKLEDHVFQEQSTAILEGYKSRREQVLKEFGEEPSPELIAYKLRSKQVADEVAAMPSGAFVDEASRNEYLRQQLQQARVEIYSQAE